MAYDNMGMAYYYLGNLDCAKHYHMRMTNKMLEPSTSLQKLYCISNEETNKQKHKLQSSVRNKFEFNSHVTSAATSEDEKINMIFRQFIISTEGDETPRLVRHESVRYMKNEDLPSPCNLGSFAPSLRTNPILDKRVRQQRELMVKLRHHVNLKVASLITGVEETAKRDRECK
jgi:hypothetical protein